MTFPSALFLVGLVQSFFACPNIPHLKQHSVIIGMICHHSPCRTNGHSYTYSLTVDGAYIHGNCQVVQLCDQMICDDIPRNVCSMRVVGVIAWLCLWDEQSGVQLFVFLLGF